MVGPEGLGQTNKNKALQKSATRAFPSGLRGPVSRFVALDNEQRIDVMTTIEIGKKPGLRNATMLVHSGLYFDFLNPRPDQVTIEDIAHGLSNTCRFNGQCNHFYSVAQHSVHVSNLVPPKFAFAALMHDAAEAYVGDVVGPLKQLLPDYKAIEKRVEIAVTYAFGLSLEDISHPEIKHADLRMLRSEQMDLTSRPNDDWSNLSDYNRIEGRIDPWPPRVAKYKFLARFHELAPDPTTTQGEG